MTGRGVTLEHPVLLLTDHQVGSIDVSKEVMTATHGVRDHAQ